MRILMQHPRRTAFAAYGLISLIIVVYAITTIIAAGSISFGLYSALAMIVGFVPLTAMIYSRGKWIYGGLLIGSTLITALILLLPPFTVTTESFVYTPLGQVISDRAATNAALPPDTTDAPPADIGPSGH